MKVVLFLFGCPHLLPLQMVTLKIGYILPITFDIFLAGRDYEELTVSLNFSISSTTQVVPLSIVDDDVLENDEVFTTVLEVIMDEYDNRVLLQPNVSTINILDNDSEHNITKLYLYRLIGFLLLCFQFVAVIIGFFNHSYTVSEGVEVLLSVGLRNGQVGYDVVVDINTQTLSAVGW